MASFDWPSTLPGEVLTTISATKTPGATNNYNLMSGNSLTLTAGIWRVTGNAGFSNGGSSPAYTSIQLILCSANGADTGSIPAALTAISGLTILSETSDVAGFGVGRPAIYDAAPNASNSSIYGLDTIISVASTATIFAVTRAALTTAGNARITAAMTAIRIR